MLTHPWCSLLVYRKTREIIAVGRGRHLPYFFFSWMINTPFLPFSP